MVQIMNNSIVYSYDDVPLLQASASVPVDDLLHSLTVRTVRYGETEPTRTSDDGNDRVLGISRSELCGCGW